MHSLSHTLHNKLSNNSKSNLHSGVGNKHIVTIEDKENRRDMVNRQSQQIAGVGSSNGSGQNSNTGTISHNM